MQMFCDAVGERDVNDSEAQAWLEELFFYGRERGFLLVNINVTEHELLKTVVFLGRVIAEDIRKLNGRRAEKKHKAFRASLLALRFSKEAEENGFRIPVSEVVRRIDFELARYSVPNIATLAKMQT